MGVEHLFSVAAGHYMAFDPDAAAIYAITGADELSLAQLPARLTAASSPHREPQPVMQHEHLARLSLIMLNTCNLRCHYCYEDGGTFGLEHTTRMEAALALRAIRRTLETYHRIDTLMFFGGEPLLAIDAIAEVCDTLQQWGADGEITMPRLGLITNGTVYNARVERLLKRHPLHITVSVDGPEDAHNENRVFANGRGSYAAVKRNLDHFRALGASLSIQSTLTTPAKYSVSELLTHFDTDLGTAGAHIVPAFGDVNDGIVSAYRAATDAYCWSLLEAEPLPTANLIRTMLHDIVAKRIRPALCPAGHELAVDPEGNIYPCFMFVGQPQLQLGHIDQPLGAAFHDRLAAFMMKNAKRDNDQCRACWARHICHGCMGGNQLASGSVDITPPSQCTIIQAIAEQTIAFLGAVRSDQTKWRALLSRLDMAPHPPC